MGLAVKSEGEHRQDRCLHLLERISEDDRKDLHEDGKQDYKYRCVKCGRYLRRLNGVLKFQNETEETDT